MSFFSYSWMFISYILFLFLIEVNVVDSEFDQIFRECAGGWIYIYMYKVLFMHEHEFGLRLNLPNEN